MAGDSANRADRLRALCDELRLIRAEVDAYTEHLRELSARKTGCTAAELWQVTRAIDALNDQAAQLRAEFLMIHHGTSEPRAPGFGSDLGAAA